MATKELTHTNIFKHIYEAAAAVTAVTAAFDTGLPFPVRANPAIPPGLPGSTYVGTGGNQYAEAVALLSDIASGNLGAGVTVTLQLQESDAVGSGTFTNVDPLYCEWFQDGVPGYPSGVPGSQIWTPNIPGNVPPGSGAALGQLPMVLPTHCISVSHSMALVVICMSFLTRRL